MHQNILLILSFLFVLFLLVMIAQKIKVAYPIFLVVAGLCISLIPGVPRIHINPDTIFLIFLPPLLYEAAWYTSWNDFWKWKRPIALLAFGLVIFTSTIVAFASSALIPGFTLSLGFLLGGIISPPDAIAATTVLKGMKIPKRAMTILEGESLVNDASSLIVFKFALLAVLTGTFSMKQATESFILIASMGIVIGLAGANIMYLVHRFLPTTPPIDAALTVMTPYVLFLTSEMFHFSGVLSVVSGGLFLSYRSHEVFRTGSTRVNMLGVWNTLIFVMNALVFILIGLELPEIISGLGGYSLREAIGYGVTISLIVIAVRYLWVYPAAFLPRLLSRSIREREPSPGWKGPLLISWSGMRGVVSLASALSIPLLMDSGVPFPHRNLILFITFVVIFFTLVVQGLTLPWVVRKMRMGAIEHDKPEEEQRANIQLRLDKVAHRILHAEYLPDKEYNDLIRIYNSNLEHDIKSNENRLTCIECGTTRAEDILEYHSAMLKIFEKQRAELFSMRRSKQYSDEEIRKAEMQLDLNELKITGTER